MRKTFHFYADPGHGWLAVRKDELLTLGIAKQISSCSYKDRVSRANLMKGVLVANMGSLYSAANMLPTKL